MTDPVLHVLAGPNGAGKSSLYAHLVEPTTHLPFVNADVLAAARWPGDELARAYDASRLAADERTRLLEARRSFVTETVFSHESKLQLLRDAIAAGYLVTLHVVLVPVELSVVRVRVRHEQGGHDVPEDKIRARHERLWPLVVEAIAIVQAAEVYDNSRAATPFRRLASFRDGRPLDGVEWPSWTPPALTDAF